jgi:predicted nucleic acid-binding protein
LILFFDSSALVKRYVREIGTEAVLDLIHRAELLLASRLTWLEITSAIVRVAQSGRLSAPSEIIRAVDDDFSTLIGILEVTPAVIADARQAALRHGLRAADAVQLATALTARLWHGDDIRFVCADQRLLAAARSESIDTVEPGQSASP